MVSGYVPNRGDIIWVDFDPVLGHEQAGKRPAIVLSPGLYHKRSSLLIACPITTKSKGYPFEVAVKVGKVDGVILVDQIKSIDWHKRPISFDSSAKASTLSEVTTKLNALIGG